MKSIFYLCSDKKSEHRTVTKTGTATIRKGVFSENAYMGTGEYEISCSWTGSAYGWSIRPSFFYSFQIPRLGKGFDLLQIKDEQIVNIELKSGAVSDETIRKQLTQNRYYLSVLGRPIYSYTYISSQNRLVRLTNHDHIVEADWQQLCGNRKNSVTLWYCHEIIAEA